jgi:hypothetical protein
MTSKQVTLAVGAALVTAINLLVLAAMTITLFFEAQRDGHFVLS